MTRAEQGTIKCCRNTLLYSTTGLGRALIHGASSSKRWATPSIQWEALKRKWTCSTDSTLLGHIGHRSSKTFTGLVVGLADTLCQDSFCRYNQDEPLGVKPLSSLKTLKISQGFTRYQWYLAVTRWFLDGYQVISRPLQAIEFRRCLKESTAPTAACYPNSACSWSWSKLHRAFHWKGACLDPFFCAPQQESSSDATVHTFGSKVVSLAPSQQLHQRNVIFIWLHNWTSFGFGTLSGKWISMVVLVVASIPYLSLVRAISAEPRLPWHTVTYLTQTSDSQHIGSLCCFPCRFISISERCC